MRLTEDIARHLTGKKIFISSGILSEKKEMVTEALKRAAFAYSIFWRKKDGAPLRRNSRECVFRHYVFAGLQKHPVFPENSIADIGK